MPILYTLIAITLFALTLSLIGRCHFLEGKAGPALISFSGGFAVAYVFVDVLPKLASKQEVLLRTSDQGILRFLEHHAYVVALLGLVIFFGASHLTRAQLAARKTQENFLRRCC